MSTISVQNICKAFGSHTALHEISFDIPQHIRCVGFLGPNGSGKTTTIRLLTGLMKPDSGSIEVAGIDVIRHPDHLRSIIGYVEQHPALLSWMTGREFLQFIGSLFSLPPALCKERTEILLEKVGLQEAANRRIGGYSGGMKKRLGIAQGLMGNPRVLFLDEPVAEMDPIGRMEILQLIEHLKQEVTIFMSSHILEDIERTADQIIILHQGRIQSISTLVDLKHKYATSKILVDVLEGHYALYGKLKNGELDGIKSVEWHKGKLCISMVNDEHFNRNLQAFLFHNQYVLTHYEWTEPNLEEIFMKVVTG